MPNYEDDFYDMTLEEQEHEYDVEHIHARLVMNNLATEIPYDAGMSHVRAAVAFMLNHREGLSHMELNNVATLNLTLYNLDKEYAPGQNERGVYH